MTIAEAKRVLLLYRPGIDDPEDPEIAAALRLLEADAELRAWFDEFRAGQALVRARLRAIEPPAALRARIIAAHPSQPPRNWTRPAWLAAAAVIVALLVLAGLLRRPEPPEAFASYRSRMVRTVLREYRMDIETNDLREVRQFMAANGAPSDYVLPAGLSRLKLAGGGALRWRNRPVAMVCFDRGDNELLYLFVIDQAGVPDAPPARPALTTVNKLLTASWTRNGRAYVLAGPAEPAAEFARKYL